MKRKKRLGVGSLRIINGCWQFRYYDKFGRRQEPVFQSLPVSSFPNKTAAWLSEEVQSIVRGINPQPKGCSVTMSQLITEYQLRDMPQRHSTQKAYKTWLTNYITPKWGEYLLDQIRPLEVKTWLEDLPLAPKSKVEIRGIMGRLFNKARLYEYLPLQSQNPMSLVTIKGGSRRRKRPTTLPQSEFELLLAQLPENPWRVAVLADQCLGLRASELMALQWGDCDWTTNTVKVQRGIVDGRIDSVKTECSEKPLPLAPKLANWLLVWRGQSQYRADSDFIFASPHTGGKKPYSYGSLLAWVKFAAKKAGLGKVGTHTFRHSYKSGLDRRNTPPGVQKDLMRHASYKQTDQYGDSVPDVLRKANEEYVEELTQKIQ